MRKIILAFALVFFSLIAKGQQHYVLQLQSHSFNYTNFNGYQWTPWTQVQPTNARFVIDTYRQTIFRYYHDPQNYRITNYYTQALNQYGDRQTYYDVIDRYNNICKIIFLDYANNQYQADQVTVQYNNVIFTFFVNLQY